MMNSERPPLSNLNDLKDTSDSDNNNTEYDFSLHGNVLSSSAVDESEAAHDQLPNVEEYKAQVGSSASALSSTNNNHRCLKIGLIVALFVIAVIVSLTVGILIGIDEEIVLEEDIQDRSPVAPPVVSPTLHPDDAPRKYQIEKLVAEQQWSDLYSLTAAGSPQNRAVQFMAEDDRQLPIAATTEFKERYAAAVLYFAWNGQDWRDALFWMRPSHHCEWMASLQDDTGEHVSVGVICDDDKLTVTAVYMAGLEMRGTIPPEIGLLQNLTVLDLSGATHLTSGDAGIPWEAFNQLSKLQTLNLAFNNFTGLIDPRLNVLESLNTLNLANNSFSGVIPTTLAANLRELLILNLENNQLEGSLDPLQDCTAEAILLGGNNIESTLKEEIYTSWTRLETLDLSDNELIGVLPAGLFAMPTLIVLDLHGNKLTGPLPDLVSVNSNIEFLALQDNQLSGSIGDKYRYLESLQHFDLSKNQFDGPIPTDFSMLPDLRYLFLAFNVYLTAGPIPSLYGNMMNLVDLSLQGTNRNETIPTELGQLGLLQLLDLGDNDLSGPIPSELSTMEQLRFLLLKDNKLSGDIPNSFMAMERLQIVVLNENSLSGSTNELCDGSDAFNIQSLDLIVSDCGALTCECCVCCETQYGALTSECVTPIWFSDVDPVDSPFYRYKRGFYVFQNSEVQYPSVVDEDEADDIENAPIWFDPAAPLDIDGDGTENAADADMDGDGINNTYDGDRDGDGTPNFQDTFEYNPLEDADTDGDGIGDNADGDPSDETAGDSDGDGMGDNEDGAPDDASLGDSDGDGVGDNADELPDDPTQYDTDPGDDAGGVR